MSKPHQTNCTVPYDTIAKAVRDVMHVAHNAQGSQWYLCRVLEAKLETLDKLADLLAKLLQQRGLAPETAMRSACTFVMKVAMAAHAERAGAT